MALNKRHEAAFGPGLAKAIAGLVRELDQLDGRLSAAQSSLILEPFLGILAPRYSLRIAEVNAESAGGLLPAPQTRQKRGPREFKVKKGSLKSGESFARKYGEEMLALIARGVNTRDELARELMVSPRAVSAMVHLYAHTGRIVVGEKYRHGKPPIQSYALADVAPDASPGGPRTPAVPTTAAEWQAWVSSRKTRFKSPTLADFDELARAEFGMAPDWAAVFGGG